VDCTYAVQMDLGYPLAALISLAVLISLAGMAGAYRLGRRTRPEMVSAVCLCKHAISFHKNLTDACKYRSRFERYCTCQHYAGPEMISSVTMRSIAEDV
jgi:hypothetical protein